MQLEGPAAKNNMHLQRLSRGPESLLSATYSGRGLLLGTSSLSEVDLEYIRVSTSFFFMCKVKVLSLVSQDVHLRATNIPDKREFWVGILSLDPQPLFLPVHRQITVSRNLQNQIFLALRLTQP